MRNGNENKEKKVIKLSKEVEFMKIKIESK